MPANMTTTTAHASSFRPIIRAQDRTSGARRDEPVGRLLVDALKANGAPLDPGQVRIPPALWARVAPAAEYHRVGPLVHAALAMVESVPPDARQSLRSASQRAVRAHLLALHALRESVDALATAGVSPVVLKGPLLTERLYGRADLRAYKDLDLLVRPAEFADAVAALESRGGRIIEANWPLVDEIGKGELNIILPPGVVVDLHWSVVYDRRRRDGFSLRTGDIVDRAVATTVGGVPVLAPDAVDELIHLCVHACLAGGHRLGWLQDVRLAALRPGLDVDEFWDRARTAGVAVPVAAVMSRVARCFGDVPGPAGIRGGAGWRMFLRAVDLLRPPTRWRGPAVSGQFLFAGTGRSTASSFLGAARTAQTSVRELVTAPDHPWRSANASVSPNPLERPLGGLTARRKFLAGVARTEGP